MVVSDWILLFVGVMLYFLIGQLLLLNYLINYKPQERTVWLGVQSLLWPLVILFDLGVYIAVGLSSSAKTVSGRISEKQRKGEI